LVGRLEVEPSVVSVLDHRVTSSRRIVVAHVAQRSGLSLCLIHGRERLVGPGSASDSAGALERLIVDIGGSDACILSFMNRPVIVGGGDAHVARAIKLSNQLLLAFFTSGTSRHVGADGIHQAEASVMSSVCAGGFAAMDSTPSIGALHVLGRIMVDRRSCLARASLGPGTRHACLK